MGRCLRRLRALSRAGLLERCQSKRFRRRNIADLELWLAIGWRLDEMRERRRQTGQNLLSCCAHLTANAKRSWPKQARLHEMHASRHRECALAKVIWQCRRRGSNASNYGDRTTIR
eukprot:scaffold196874_cov43-Prasinocladus_malaysianus.AAC.2